MAVPLLVISVGVCSSMGGGVCFCDATSAAVVVDDTASAKHAQAPRGRRIASQFLYAPSILPLICRGVCLCLCLCLRLFSVCEKCSFITRWSPRTLSPSSRTL